MSKSCATRAADTWRFRPVLVLHSSQKVSELQIDHELSFFIGSLADKNLSNNRNHFKASLFERVKPQRAAYLMTKLCFTGGYSRPPIVSTRKLPRLDFTFRLSSEKLLFFFSAKNASDYKARIGGHDLLLTPREDLANEIVFQGIFL